MGFIGLTLLAFLLWGRQAGAESGLIRTAYFYHYMGPDHLDSLAAHGFNRAVIHWIPDTLGVVGVREASAFVARGLARGVDVVPKWLLQNPARLASRPRERRYTWGRARVEPEVPCPLDSAYWRAALLDRAAEFLQADSAITRLAVDLELYRSARHHYDAGACVCGSCRELYAGRPVPADPSRLSGLLGFEEARLERLLTGILAELAARWPGAELGVFDLDYDSFVHRALARALVRAGVATVDYCERSYAAAGVPLPAVRLRLDALGLEAAPLIGGLWLKRFPPRDVPRAARSVVANADGYFVFTTFSLWLDPAKLTGPYTLLGPPAEYWQALAEVNRP
jgi:hypothetical protein